MKGYAWLDEAGPVLHFRTCTHPGSTGAGGCRSGALAGPAGTDGAGVVGAWRAVAPQLADAGGDPPAQAKGAAAALPRRALAGAVDRVVAGQPLLCAAARLLDRRAPRAGPDAGLAGARPLCAGALRNADRRPCAAARARDRAGGGASRELARCAYRPALGPARRPTRDPAAAA